MSFLYNVLCIGVAIVLVLFIVLLTVVIDSRENC